MNLPLDYPRINQFPEWFTADSAAPYRVTGATGAAALDVAGSDLISGLSLRLVPGLELRLTVTLKPE